MNLQCRSGRWPRKCQITAPQPRTDSKIIPAGCSDCISTKQILLRCRLYRSHRNSRRKPPLHTPNKYTDDLSGRVVRRSGLENWKDYGGFGGNACAGALIVTTAKGADCACCLPDLGCAGTGNVARSSRLVIAFSAVGTPSSDPHNPAALRPWRLPGLAK